MLLKRISVLVFIAFLIVLSVPSSGWQGKTTPSTKEYRRPTDISSPIADAVVEMWRRGFCTKSTIYEPAKATARRASDAAEKQSLPIIQGREFKKFNPILCYAVSGGKMYVGTDSMIVVIDTATREVIRQYKKADGLPDEQVTAIAPDGKDLWVLTLGGVVRLSGGKFMTEGMPQCSAGKFLVTSDATWLVSDTGFYRYDRRKSLWESIAGAPWTDRISHVIKRGVWRNLWQQTMERIFQEFVTDGKKLWFLSLGTLYSYDRVTGVWSSPATSVTSIVVTSGTLWAITPKSVIRLTPSGQNEYTAGGDLPVGAPTFIAADGDDIWVAIKSEQDTNSASLKGGGIARFKATEEKWETFREINGEKIFIPTFVGKIGGDIAVAVQSAEKTRTVLAHPGMAHITRVLPDITVLAVHRYTKASSKWTTTSLPLVFPEERCVVGEWGTYQMAHLGPISIETLSGDGQHIFATYAIKPKDYYAGYYMTIGRFATIGKEWEPSYVNNGSDLDMMGEQPDLLMIARSHGDEVVLGEGQYRILGMETIDNRVWVISEGVVGCYDGKWHQVFRSPYRFYWIVTCAVADDEYVWFGCDRELLTRLKKSTGEWEVVGRIEGRSITSITIHDGKIYIRSQKYTEGNLPPPLRGVPVIGNSDILVFDNGQWKGAEQFPSTGATSPYGVNSIGVLSKGDVGKGVIPGVFQPVILCEDTSDGSVWLKTYDGVIRVFIKGK